MVGEFTNEGELKLFLIAPSQGAIKDHFPKRLIPSPTLSFSNRQLLTTDLIFSL